MTGPEHPKKRKPTNSDDPTAPPQDEAGKVEPREWVRAAALYYWTDLSVTQTELGKKTGRSRSTIQRMMRTEEWDVAFIEAGREVADRILRAAPTALLKAWQKGNPVGALDMLRARDIVKVERREITGAGGAPIELDVTTASERLARALDRLAARDGEGGTPGT